MQDVVIYLENDLSIYGSVGSLEVESVEGGTFHCNNILKDKRHQW